MSQREIERRTGVDRKTIRRYAAAANSPGVATGSEALAAANSPTPATGSRTAATAASALRSRTAPWIEEPRSVLGRNAVSIYQDLVESTASRTATTR